MSGRRTLVAGVDSSTQSTKVVVCDAETQSRRGTRTPNPLFTRTTTVVQRRSGEVQPVLNCPTRQSDSSMAICRGPGPLLADPLANGWASPNQRLGGISAGSRCRWRGSDQFNWESPGQQGIRSHPDMGPDWCHRWATQAVAGLSDRRRRRHGSDSVRRNPSVCQRHHHARLKSVRERWSWSAPPDNHRRKPVTG